MNERTAEGHRPRGNPRKRAKAEISRSLSLHFLGIGAQKAGTTWLHKQLSQHPNIGLPSTKEMHFWDRSSLRAHSILRYHEQFKNLPGEIHGEITPAYAILPVERISVIHEFFPDIQLIFLLRNPIERAWSHARMESPLSSAESFEDIRDHDQWFLEHFRSEASLRRGDYANCLNNWTTVFPPSALKVVFFEQIKNDPLQLLSEIADFLSVDSDPFEGISEATLQENVTPENLRIRKLKGFNSPLPKRFQNVLAEIYKPRLLELRKVFPSPFIDDWIMQLYGH